MENILLQQTDYMTIYHTLRDGLETLVDTRKLTQVSNVQNITITNTHDRNLFSEWNII